MDFGATPRAVWVALVTCWVVLVSGCGGSSHTDSAAQPRDPGCKKAGIRYAGRSASGVAVCFTLIPDTRTWLEIGYLALRPKNCPGVNVGAYFPQSFPGIAPGQLLSDFFTARIRGGRASGTIHDSSFCNGKRFAWTGRATRPLTAEELRNLKPSPTGVCSKPGIHFVGTTPHGGVQVCFTLNRYRSSLVESGWRWGQRSGCTGVTPGESLHQTEKIDLEGGGRFDDGLGLTGTVRGDKASGVLRADFCPGKTFGWRARRIP